MTRKFTPTLLFTLAASTALVSPALAQQAQPTAAGQADACAHLDQLLQTHSERLQDAWMNEARGTVQAGDTQTCVVQFNQAVAALDLTDEQRQQLIAQAEEQVGAAEVGAADVEPGRIVITQPEPQIAVQPGQPEVTVTQGPPQVQVIQAEPRVQVTMQQPTITIEQAPPEIVIRLPDPEVALTSQQPQVEVHQPDPEVRVGRLSPGQVQMQPGQPAQVEIERADPEVAFQAAEPQIDFQMVGEPQVQIQQMGEPVIRFERMTPETAAADQQQPEPAPDEQVALQPDPMQPELQPDSEITGAIGEEPVIPRDAEGQVDVVALITAGSEMSLATEEQAYTAGDLIGRQVANVNGVNLGTIEAIIESEGERYVALGADSILGDGDSMVVLPLANVEEQDNVLVFRGLTDQEFAQLQMYDDDQARELTEADQITVAVR